MKEINKRHHTPHTQHAQRAGIAQTETAGHITGRTWGKTPNRNRRAYPGKHTGDNSPTDKPDTGTSTGRNSPKEKPPDISRQTSTGDSKPKQTSRTPATAGASPHETASLMTVIFESETSKHPTKL